VTCQRCDSTCRRTEHAGDGEGGGLWESERLHSQAAGKRSGYAQRDIQSETTDAMESFAGEQASDQAESDPNKHYHSSFSLRISA
jgi:hypothetical protein